MSNKYSLNHLYSFISISKFELNILLLYAGSIIFITFILQTNKFTVSHYNFTNKSILGDIFSCYGITPVNLSNSIYTRFEYIFINFILFLI